jgi:hypothetical protein
LSAHVDDVIVEPLLIVQPLKLLGIRVDFYAEELHNGALLALLLNNLRWGEVNYTDILL